MNFTYYRGYVLFRALKGLLCGSSPSQYKDCTWFSLGNRIHLVFQSQVREMQQLSFATNCSFPLFAALSRYVCFLFSNLRHTHLLVNILNQYDRLTLHIGETKVYQLHFIGRLVEIYPFFFEKKVVFFA